MKRDRGAYLRCIALRGPFMNTPLIPHAAARRHHRRNLRPRPGAGRSLRRARRRRRLRRPPRRCGREGGAPHEGLPRHRRRRRAQGRRARHRPAGRRRARRPRRPGQQRLQPRPGAAGPARRYRMRGLRGGARHQPGRPVPSHQGAARPARRRGARRRRRGPPLGDPQRLERRRGHALRRLGRVRREQGGAGAHEPDLGRGAPAARHHRPRRRSGRHGHAAACPRACPTPIRRR